MHSLVVNWEKRGRSPNYDGPTFGCFPGTSAVNMLPFNTVGISFKFMHSVVSFPSHLLAFGQLGILLFLVCIIILCILLINCHVVCKMLKIMKFNRFHLFNFKGFYRQYSTELSYYPLLI